MINHMKINNLYFILPLLTVLFSCASRQNEEVPGTYPAEEIKRRKIMLIIASVVAGVLVAVVIGFIALLFMAVTFM